MKPLLKIGSKQNFPCDGFRVHFHVREYTLFRNLRNTDFPHFSAFRPVGSKLSDYFSPLKTGNNSPPPGMTPSMASTLAASLASAAALQQETSCSEVSTTVDKDEDESTRKDKDEGK